MAHELAFKADGTAAMAYVGKTGTPWHGLGQSLEEGASIETWCEAAGMDYSINRSPAMFHSPATNSYMPGGNYEVLYRSDNEKPLAIVSPRYKIVQPQEVMEFFDGIIKSHGFVMDTAGVLFGGAKYWALARTPLDFKIKGVDEVKAHLMLATSCDGSMSTVAKYVATRVVCNNTVRMAMGENDGAGMVRVRHNSNFNPTDVKDKLGIIASAWEEMTTNMTALAETDVNEAQVVEYLTKLFGAANLAYRDQSRTTKLLIHKVQSLYSGEGMGATLSTAKGTAWGMMNAVTEYVDHHTRNRDDENASSRRLDNAWFGDNAKLKTDAYNLALEYANA